MALSNGYYYYKIDRGCETSYIYGGIQWSNVSAGNSGLGAEVYKHFNGKSNGKDNVSLLVKGRKGWYLKCTHERRGDRNLTFQGITGIDT